MKIHWSLWSWSWEHISTGGALKPPAEECLGWKCWCRAELHSLASHSTASAPLLTGQYYLLLQSQRLNWISSLALKKEASFCYFLLTLEIDRPRPWPTCVTLQTHPCPGINNMLGLKRKLRPYIWMDWHCKACKEIQLEQQFSIRKLEIQPEQQFKRFSAFPKPQDKRAVLDFFLDQLMLLSWAQHVNHVNHHTWICVTFFYCPSKIDTVDKTRFRRMIVGVHC